LRLLPLVASAITASGLAARALRLCDERANQLTGTAGGDLLDGKQGADVMTGGAGNDVYMVDHVGDKVVESSNGGVDLVRTTLSTYTLPTNVENLQLNGSGTQTGIGNAGDNYVLASARNDANLQGGAGNDILVSKSGAAVMTGGEGTDIFRFDNLPTRAGHVTDFTSGTDMLDFRNMFASAGYNGTDPLADSYLSLVQNASGGTNVMFDGDGRGAGAAVLVTAIDLVAPAQLRPSDFLFA
jgi:Ca2+-binding RTX toxin-like protein